MTLLMRNLKIILFIQTILLMNVVISQAQPKKGPQFDLYILIGQSNMAGRGPITPDIADEHDEHVYTFTKDKQWVIAKHPLHFDKPSVAGVGPGLTFGIALSRAMPAVKIGLIPCAVGGTPIEHWVPEAYDAATKTHPYDDAVERITAAMKYGVVKGVIWHQGEADSRPEKAKIYLAQLTKLIQRIRDLTGNPDLPFIVGELGRYRPTSININTELAKLPALVPYTAVVSSEGLVHKGDNTHFDGHSAQELGRRFAAQMLQVQDKLKNK
jgi:hypothetical protein